MTTENTESNPAINRLLQEIEDKPKVSRREDTVLDKQEPVLTTKADHKHKVPVPTSTTSSAGESRSQSSQATSSLEATEMANTRVNIEKSIYNALRKLAMAEEISRDSFMEASYLYLADHPEAMKAVIEIARERHSLRKQKGNILRAQTLQKKYSP